MSKKNNDKDVGYIQTSILGEGSFGRVFAAKPKNGKSEEVAIKVNFIDPKIDGYGRVAELQLMACLRSHPCVLSYQEVCLVCPLDRKIDLPLDDDGQVKNVKLDEVYYVMAKANCTLDKFFLKKDAFQQVVPLVKSIQLQILLGLEFLHVKKITHRDIKPDNILITIDQEHDTLSAKIGDFGLGKALDPHLGNTTTILNKYYRSPEIAARCKRYTSSVDIWSCGILFYRLLTGGKYLYEVKRDDDYLVLKAIHQLIPLKDVTYPECSKEVLESIKKDSSANMLDSMLRNNILPEVLAEFEYPEDVFEMLKQMLNPNINRITASQILNSRLFENERETITNLRKEMKISDDGKWIGKLATISVDTSIDERGFQEFRRFGFNEAIDIFNERDKREKEKDPKSRRIHPFYTEQVWFSSLDLFDRWLVWRRHPEQITSIGSDTNKEEVRISYYIALYLIVKILFSRARYRFSEIHRKFTGRWNDVKYLEDQMLVDVSKLKAYRTTIYEELEDFKQDMMKFLVELVTKNLIANNGKTWKEVAEKFVESYEATKNPKKVGSHSSTSKNSNSDS